MHFDYLIKGGTVIDGSSANSVSKVADVGINGDRIIAIGDLSGASAGKTVDARGLHVCPGFIDTHAHSEFTLVADGRAEGKIVQGVTTEISGNCGLSAAPLDGPARVRREPELEKLGIKDRWSTFSEYFEILRKKGHSVNFFSLVGHGSLRASVAGYSNTEITTGDRAAIIRKLRDALDSGAGGLSTGLIYPPGIYSDTKEIIELAREVSLRNGIYTSHMRSEDDGLLDAIDETIKIGLESNIRAHISHLKTSGERNWGKINDVIGSIEDARGRGLDLTCDRYPYIASCTGLDVVLPSWVFEGGPDIELERIKKYRGKISEEIIKTRPEASYWERIKISRVGSDRNGWMEGRSLSEISNISKKTELESLLDLLIEEKLQVEAIFFFMSEDNLRSILKYPHTMIGTDSSARSFSGITAGGKPHPRGFGCFPRMLGRYVREERIIPLEEAIYKMTGLPASTFNIMRRGRVEEGFLADITIFDFDTVIDNADFDEPFKKPDGIKYVFVNGIPVLWNDTLTGKMPGRILK